MKKSAGNKLNNKRMNSLKLIIPPKLLFLLFVITSGLANGQTRTFWWPEQHVPDSYVICSQPLNRPETVLAQSAAGLAARAVNNGQYDRMIWVESNRQIYDKWLRNTCRNLHLHKDGYRDVWQIVSSLMEHNIVKGYVLYSQDNASLNSATVHAGMLDAVLIDQSLKTKADMIGLQMLYDARFESQKDCWQQLGDSLNRRMTIAMNPKLPYNRDLAIAHQTMVYYGVDSLYREILSKTEPLTPVVGWNAGPESGHIAPPSNYALFNTASDYCSNLTFLSAGSRYINLSKAKSIDPKNIDFSKTGSFHAFMMSDGDNMQWTMDSFFSKEYYLHPACDRIPVNWTTCSANISQMSPATWNEIVRLQKSTSSLVEFSGGYLYPDVFANKYPDRWEKLRQFARQTGEHMEYLGISVLNLMILNDVSSDDAMRVYKIYAEEIKGLTGIVVLQYNPYHAGHGAVYWVKDRDGIEIPVVTPRYSLWGKASGKGFGKPDQIADMINRRSENEESMDWTIVHAWSRYTKDKSGQIIDADNNDRAAIRGVEAIEWCADNLSPSIHIVSLEELLWRIRMKHNPEITKGIIGNSSVN